MLQIDGSQGEGGGQILRTSLSLGALTGETVRIFNIRAGRSQPGLSAQHVTCCRAVAEVCNGRIEGAEMRSGEVVLHPGTITGGSYEFDVAAVRPSAGSTSLVLHSVLPVLALAPKASTVAIHGGTDVKWSPPYSYLTNTFIPALRECGVAVRLSRPRAGFYPAGEGLLKAEIVPAPEGLKPLRMVERSELQSATVSSTVTQGLAEHILHRQNEAAGGVLADEGLQRSYEEYYPESTSPGTTCVVSLVYKNGYGGFTAMGERGKPAEEVGQEAAIKARDFIHSKAAVDVHLADQLLLYMALGCGESQIRTSQVTSHLKTNAAVAQQLLDVPVAIRDSGMVTVAGRGLCPV
ncbi:MAG: RNA 3'-terminal phosphate cyclase [Armatimonadota bacterium]